MFGLFKGKGPAKTASKKAWAPKPLAQRSTTPGPRNGGSRAKLVTKTLASMKRGKQNRNAKISRGGKAVRRARLAARAKSAA